MYLVRRPTNKKMHRSTFEWWPGERGMEGGEVIRSSRQTMGEGGFAPGPQCKRQLTELGAGIWDQGLGAIWRESTNTPVKWELGTLIPWGCVE